MASEHTVTVKFDHWGTHATLVCTAPLESQCHAVYSCDCEEYGGTGTDDGRPWHLPLYEDPNEPVERHYGHFDPDECDLKNWFEETDDPLDGGLTFDVTPVWENSAYRFEIGEVHRG